MNTIGNRIILISLFFIPTFTLAQSSLNRGLIAFDVGDYEAAIPLLERTLQKKGDFRAAYPLAMSYQNLGWNQEAVSMFRLASSTKQMPDSGYLAFASALLDVGEFASASKLLNEEVSSIERFQAFDTIMDRAAHSMALLSDSIRFELINVEIPVAGSKICPKYYDNGLVFTSSLEPNKKKRDSQQYSVYHSSRKNMFSFEAPKRLAGFKKSKYSEGPLAISSDHQRYYFSRTYSKFPDPQNRIQKGGVSRILSIEQQGKKWEEPSDLNFNSWQFSNTQPTLSDNDSMMVFCSNRPGGEGGADLYWVQLEPGGWGLPVNLGQKINTPGNEYFPTLIGRDTLYFSSDGHFGLGGQDLFVTWQENGQWVAPRNLGYPANSHGDDFGIGFLPRQNLAYFSSDRRQKGFDELYALRYRPNLQIQVVDSISGLPVSGAHISVYQPRGGEQTAITNSQGCYDIGYESSLGVYLKVQSPDHFPKKVRILPSKQYPAIVQKVVVQLPRSYEAKLVGHVSDNKRRLPIQDVAVTAYFDGGQPHDSTFTDSTGRYELAFKALGKFFILYEKTGYKSEVFDKEFPSKSGELEGEHNEYLKSEGFEVVRGQVVNMETGTPIPNIKVNVVDNQDGNVLSSGSSNSEGVFWLSSNWDSTGDYSIIAAGKNYFTQKINVTGKADETGKLTIRMRLAEYGLNKLVKVIHFPANKVSLDDLSENDLNEIYYFLSENQDAFVEIQSHTDSRGRSSYNQLLSVERSNAVKSFIVSEKGIPSERVHAIGYGEDRLVNECDDAHPCSDTKHAENRRSEIRVMKYGKGD